jgi:hypothetical protein
LKFDVGDELVDGVLGANVPARNLEALRAARPRRTTRCGDCTGLAPNKKAAKNLKKVPKFTFFVCFKSGSGFNRVSGFGFGIRIRIQEGKNDQRKLKKL